MIKSIKFISSLGLLGSLLIYGDAQAKCSQENLKKYRKSYTFETNNLTIVPVTKIEEYQKLISLSKDDKLSYMYKELQSEYGFPEEKEGWDDKMQVIFDNDQFCTLTTLPILFAAYKNDGGEPIGFYAYLPRTYDYFDHTRLEQRSLLAKEAQNGGLGTEFRRAMITYFQEHILDHKFNVFSKSSKNISFREDIITALTSGVAVYNFASLISNIRACLPISRVDPDMLFTLPNPNPMTEEEFRTALCDEVIVHDEMFGPNLSSSELNPLVCDSNRPKSIAFDKNQGAKSAHNIAFSINKLIDEFAKQKDSCK